MVSTKYLLSVALVGLALAQNNGGNNNGGNNNGGNNNGGNNNGGNNNGGNNNGGNNNGGNNNNGGGGNGGTKTLDQNAIQTGSFSDGSGDANSEAGQAKSATSQENFINFCSGQTLTNGQQVQGGSCNGIPMGKIPAKNNMVSCIFVSPQNGEDVAENQTFDVKIQTQNLEAGSFTNPDSTYYAAPQDLKNGKIVGHSHVTIQDLGKSQNPTQPLDATQFAFFKGINDAGNGQGLLSATVTGGLPAGNYRACTMNSASNHQPVLLPVAQRGTPDDCIRFTVGGNKNGGNGGQNGNNGGQNGNNGGQNGNNGGQNGNNGGQNGNNGGQNGGQGGQGGRRRRGTGRLSSRWTYIE